MLRFSTLKVIARSPAHYQHALTHPFQPTPAMRLGTLVHRLVLGGAEPEPSGPPPVVYDGQRRGKAWAEFRDAHPGVEIVTIAEHERALAEKEEELAHAQVIADAVLGDMRVQRLLEGTTKERRIVGRLHGRDVHGTPDAFSDDLVLDLKTTADARPEAFVWQARKLHYATQVTWYGDLLGGRKRHVLVAVETKAPYPVTVMQLTDALVDVSRRTYVGWIEQLQACELAGVWPGYSEAILPLDATETVDLDFSEAAE